MKKTENYMNDSVQQEKPNTNQKEKIKITGTEEGISLIEEIIREMEAENDLYIVSSSELLDNKGEDRKRKFIEVNIKNVED